MAKLHPTPALGGEPKADALAWIRNHEPARRGLYGGPIGWLGIQEDIGEFAVAIRSGVFHGTEGILLRRMRDRRRFCCRRRAPRDSLEIPTYAKRSDRE